MLRDGVPRRNVTACDGIWQCPGGEDENSCDACVAGAIYCGSECFSAHSICNGFRDCPDGEDEKDCGGPLAATTTTTQRPARSCRGADKFDCGAVSGQQHCIEKRFVCDGGADCRSGVDELDCRECRADSFRCFSGWCEHKARCDGTRQCPGGEDEAGCPRDQQAGLLTCGDGTTRLATTRCDGWLACPGGEDERGCSQSECRDGAFYCGGVCKPPSRRCDGVRHCPDGEDERDCSGAVQPPPSPLACGRTTGSVDPLVANGTKAEAGSFPWHAALYFHRPDGRMMYFCGASLVTETTLLTAAHCFALLDADVHPSNISVALGKLYSSWNAETLGVHKSKVSRFTLHPDYDGVLGKHSTDIAVVHMERRAPQSKTIAPICLAGGQVGILKPRDYVTVVGWGNGSTALDELAFVKMPYLPRRRCLEALRKSIAVQVSYVTFDKFCTIRETGVTSPGGLLQGDSGGGAVVFRGGRWHLVGIVSVGLDEGRIAAMTNVTISEILSWAEDLF